MNAPRDRLIGVRIEQRYRIDAVIARGGMSTVYMGLDLRLDRPIAIKVMDPKYAEDRQFVSRFEFEARSVAKLKDPGLVAVYDQGVDGELAFLVMELVNGGTLRELLGERGPMPPHAVAAVMAPVLGALGTAHRAGLVHRDVKPENILISDAGEVKIADFGLVRAIAAASVTSSSVILGTAAYLSPEQVESGIADPRSDVYSAGIMVYELLTGNVPFTGDTAISLAYQRLHNDVPAPSRAIAGVPPELDEFVARATQRDPDARFADGEAMAEALAAIAHRLRLPAFTVPAPRSSAEQRAAVALYDAQRNQPHIPAAAEPTGMVPSGPPTAALGAATMGLEPPTAALGDAAAPRPTRAESMHAALPEELPPARPRRRGRTRTYVVIALIAIAALLLAIGGWWIGVGRWTTVPVISGLDRTAAESAIKSAGLDVVEVPGYSNDITEDTVTSIQPAPGTRVTRYSPVRLGYSLGKPIIPQFTMGASVDQVDGLLRARGLDPVDGPSQFNPDVAQGGVIGLSPTPGTRVDVGSTVTVVASAGNHPVTVPDVRGKSESDARNALTQAGLTVSGTRQQFDSGVDAGLAIGTDPSGQVARGSSVTLLISDALTVPDVTGKSVSDAQAALQSAGLVGDVSSDDSGSGSDGTGVVTQTDPAAGALVDPANNHVTLTVATKVVVPSVTGMSVGEARQTLEAMGLNVKVQGLLSSDSSQVIWQSPGGGSRIDAGSTVTLTALP